MSLLKKFKNNEIKYLKLFIKLLKRFSYIYLIMALGQYTTNYLYRPDMLLYLCIAFFGIYKFIEWHIKREEMNLLDKEFIGWETEK